MYYEAESLGPGNPDVYYITSHCHAPYCAALCHIVPRRVLMHCERYRVLCLTILMSVVILTCNCVYTGSNLPLLGRNTTMNRKRLFLNYFT